MANQNTGIENARRLQNLVERDCEARTKNSEASAGDLNEDIANALENCVRSLSFTRDQNDSSFWNITTFSLGDWKNATPIKSERMAEIAKVAMETLASADLQRDGITAESIHFTLCVARSSLRGGVDHLRDSFELLSTQSREIIKKVTVLEALYPPQDGVNIDWRMCTDVMSALSSDIHTQLGREPQPKIKSEDDLTISDEASEYLRDVLSKKKPFNANISLVQIGDAWAVGINDKDSSLHFVAANQAAEEKWGFRVAMTAIHRCHILNGAKISGACFRYNPTDEAFEFTRDSKDFGGFKREDFLGDPEEFLEKFIREAITEIQSEE